MNIKSFMRELRYGAFVLGLPTIVVGLIACLCLYNGARMEAQTARPVASKALSSYQWVLTSLTPCSSAACYPQAGGANDTADMYVGTVLGQTTNSGVVSAGVVVVGTSTITLTFLDGNGVAWATTPFPAASSGTIVYPLGALLGVYFAKGLSVTCSGACSSAQLQVYYQR